MSTLRKYGRGLRLAARVLYVELFGKPLKDSTTAPTDGQVLGYVAADQAWQPVTVSGGGGSLPSGSTGSLLRHNGTAYVSYGIGSAGQVLRVSGGTAVWSTLVASDVGAIAAPGSPSNGGVLAYAGGAWVAVGAGTSGQVLRSNGASAPTWGSLTASDVGAVPTARAITAGTGLSGGGDLSSDRTLSVSFGTTGTTACVGNDARLSDARTPITSTGYAWTAAQTIQVTDGVGNTALSALTLSRRSSGTAASGIGVRILLQSEDAADNGEDVVYLDGVLTNAGNGTEASAFDVHTRTGGAAPRRVARVTAGGGLMLGAAVTQDPGVGGIAIPTTTGLYIESGGTLYNAVGVFGGSAMSFGSGAFNVTIAAFALTISSAGGTVMSGGYLDLAAGFRRRRTVVNNGNHTVTAGQSVIDMLGLTVARTVTLPPFAEGAIVTICNGDGSADGTKTISVVASSGTNNINGVTTLVGINTAFGSVTLICDATNNRWTVIAKVT